MFFLPCLEVILTPWILLDFVVDKLKSHSRMISWEVKLLDIAQMWGKKYVNEEGGDISEIAVC